MVLLVIVRQLGVQLVKVYCNHQQIVKNAEQSDTTFQGRLARMNLALCRIVGQLCYQSALVLDKRGYIVDTDGSVKNNKGEGGVVLIDSNRDRTMSCVPVDGQEQFNSFLFKEIALLVGILIVDMGDPSGKSSGKLWSDSKLSLDWLKQIYQIPEICIQTLEKEYPVFNKTQLLTKMNSRMTLNWVESHSISKSTEAQLNGLADELAAKQHKVQGRWVSRFTKAFLPNQKAQLLFLQGNVYDRNHGLELTRHVHGNVAEQHIGTKMNIIPQDLKQIDWDAIRD